MDAALLAAAERELLAQRFEEVEVLLAPHVSQERPSGRGEFLYGLSLHKRKRYARALPWFDAAGAAPEAWSGSDALPYFRGWCLYYLGDLDAAEASFLQHNTLVPTEGDTVFALGLIEFDRGETEAAIARFESAVALFEQAIGDGAQNLVPDLAKTWARLGEAQRAAGRLVPARDALANSLRLYPAHPPVWYQLGSVLTELGDAEGAEKAFQMHERWRAAQDEGAASNGK